jgi:CDP-glycerol glycerophosphotransferase (TagB/SpsB family)
MARDARALEPPGLARVKPDGIGEIYAYLPTFRDTGRDFLQRALPDLPALDAVLRQRNALLYLKLHRHTADRLPALGERIFMWPAAADFYAHLDELSGLITDYSSVYYDYIHGLSTGAILYAFDEDQYTVSDRSLLYPYRNNTVGARAATFVDLLRILRNGEAFVRQPELSEIRSKFWGDASETACARITRYLDHWLALKVSNCDVTRLSSTS